MGNKLLEVVVKPLVNRLGTIIATFLVVSMGTDASLANEIGTAVVAVALLSVDLVSAHLARRAIKREAVGELIETKFDNRGR